MKKAQITLFIIIGIIIIAAVVIYVSVRQLPGEELASEEIAVEPIPLQLQPIKPYIEQCIEKTAVDGLKKLGERAGYITPEEFGIIALADSTAGDAVRLTPGSTVEIPYWHYLKDDNGCIGSCLFASKKPALYRTGGKSSIEVQLDNYMLQNLRICLNDFSALKEQGFIVEEKGQLKARTAIGEEDITFFIEYPLIFSRENTSSEISQFSVRVPLNLKKIYQFASYITGLQQQYHFLERDAMNLIAGFSARDENKLPPLADSVFGTDKVVKWKKSEVRGKLEEILASYIPALQVEGSFNYQPRQFIGEPLKDGLYNIGMLIPGNESYSDLGISFSYLSWPIYFDLNCRGEDCQPESISFELVSFLTLQKYNFVYDISFPVLVEIHDPTAFNNQGYDFAFMLEANVRNNEPMKPVFTPVTRLGVVPSSLLCNENQKNSGEIELSVRDSMTNLAIDDVQVAFSCGEESCLVGTTSAGKTTAGKLTEKFPVCIGGIVTFMNDGYIHHAEILNTKLGEEDSLTMFLNPLLVKNAVVKKKKLVKSGNEWLLRDEPLFLTGDETATISLTRKGNKGDQEHSSIAEVNGTQKGRLVIAPGSYEATVSLISGEKIIIPEQEVCVDLVLKKDCRKIDRLELNTSMAGSSTITYTFTPQELQKDVIVFYVLSADINSIPPEQRKTEDLEILGRLGEYTQQYQKQLLPIFE